MSTDMIIVASILLILAAIICFLWRFSIRGRIGHPGLSALHGWNYAHRGLHGNGIPENSMAAFRLALENGYGIELDVHLLADGNLAVMHDSELIRTAGAQGFIEDLTTADLQNHHLEGTGETIPTFRQVLDLFAGKAPLIIELKVHKNNHAALTEAACRMMEGYEGLWCMESFDPRCLLWLKKNRPEVIRGQLSENYMDNPKIKLPWILKFTLSNNMGNFLTKPDFIAYRYADRHHTRSNRICMKRMTGVSWTLRTPEEYTTATQEGWIPIFENFKP